MAKVVVIRDISNTEVSLRAHAEPQEVPDEIVAKFPAVFEQKVAPAPAPEPKLEAKPVVKKKAAKKIEE